jgi:hypothetical protein
MRYPVRTRFAHGIEQTAATKDFGSQLSAIGTRFEKLLHQHGDSYVAVTRRRGSRSIPPRQEKVRRATDAMHRIPNAYANTRAKNRYDGFAFRRNENLAGMKKV